MPTWWSATSLTWRERVREILRERRLMKDHIRMLINVLYHYEEIVHHGFAEQRKRRRRKVPDTNVTGSDEATIGINGTWLTYGQSMTVRVAIETFAMQVSQMGLGDDPTGKGIAANYLARVQEIRELLYPSGPNTLKETEEMGTR